VPRIVLQVEITVSTVAVQRIHRGLPVLVVMLVVMLAVWAGPASALPADDHQRGLTAYQRGDVVAAMAALRPAASSGYAPSQALLAYILDKADFPDEAARLYQAASDQGDAEGHAGLAAACLNGRGVAKDEKRALQHFSKAAALGHEASMAVLVQAYRQGLHGLPVDAAQASAWATRIDALRRQRAAAGASSAPRGK
jgi:TPR repeat protein